jgi:hypothetical protein
MRIYVIRGKSTIKWEGGNEKKNGKVIITEDYPNSIAKISNA